MGVGMDGEINYTEDDVKACSSAFTAGTWLLSCRSFPMAAARGSSCTIQRTTMIARRPSLVRRGAGTARTLSTSLCDNRPRHGSSPHLYNFFVADEPQVPAWKDTPPRDPEAIRTLEKAFVESNYDIRSVASRALQL